MAEMSDKRRGRPARAPELALSASLNLRLTEADRELIDRVCGPGGPSEWARAVLLRAARRLDATLQANSPKRPEDRKV